MTQEDQNLQSLFANLNQVSRNTMIREKAGGGTGGGSDLVEGSMDPNTLMTGNPYIAKNVVEFNNGGYMSEAASQMKPSIQPRSGVSPLQNNPYMQKLNAMVSVGQMKNVMDGLMMAVPQANYGMKRKYQEGGNFPHNMYHPETGYKIVAQDKAAHTKLAKAGFGHTPKAAYGMKRKYVSGGMYGEEPKAAYGMKRKYTQGGRF